MCVKVCWRRIPLSLLRLDRDNTLEDTLCWCAFEQRSETRRRLISPHEHPAGWNHYPPSTYLTGRIENKVEIPWKNKLHEVCIIYNINYIYPVSSSGSPAVILYNCMTHKHISESRIGKYSRSSYFSFFLKSSFLPNLERVHRYRHQNRSFISSAHAWLRLLCMSVAVSGASNRHVGAAGESKNSILYYSI